MSTTPEIFRDTDGNPEIILYNAKAMDILRLYPDNHFNLAVIDPPYNLERFRNGIGENDRFTTKADAGFNNNPPDEEFFNELFRVSKNQIIWGANNFVLPTSEYFLIWNKMQTVPNFASAEYAYVSMGLKIPAKVFDYSIHKHNQTTKIHPTQKPIPLYDFIFKTYAKPGNKILDCFLGSGAIMHALDKANKQDGMNLTFTGVEMNETYFNDAIDWYKQDVIQATGTINFL